MAKFAHISEDRKRVQTVAEHLEHTAHLAREFAASFGAADSAELAGWLHDIGKYSDAFQKRLQGGSKVDHSTAGAQEAFRLQNIPVAFAVAGHHSGMPDGGNRLDNPDEGTLCSRMKKQVEDCSAWKQEIHPLRANLPVWLQGNDILAQVFFTRMLYSCLVDADFLDTEAFMNEAPVPRGTGAPLAELYPKVKAMAEHFLSGQADSEILQQRNRVLQTCIQAGRSSAQGLYTLTVPTGGGKTFASLAFSMEHALAQGLNRIIYVIPYTSIIDQTAQIFSNLLGEENVLAHYATAEYKLIEQENLSDLQYRQLLASENWDAPVIVTTAVQFFESLYSNRSSRCRKLHNIANSVVIFDEAQTIPNDYLMPCLSAISQLVQHYRTTAVLCTATQPAFEKFFQKLLPNLTLQEIIPNQEQLYHVLRRNTLQNLGAVSAGTLCAQLRDARQVLCVVNRRKTAQDIYASLPAEGSFCLTTLLCAADRRRQLAEIRQRLQSGLPCRVVSTSLIEAGVDVDFPLAYREIVGLEQLIQTAGRCNREGLRPADNSFVYSFRLEGVNDPQILRPNVDATRYVMRCVSKLDTPEAIRLYFQELFTQKSDDSFDKKRILSGFLHGIDGCSFPFSQTAEKFNLIEDSTRTIYIPIGGGEALCQKLRSGRLSRTLLRQLGVYSVNCYSGQFQKLESIGALQTTDTGQTILVDLTQYDSKTGLHTGTEHNDGIFI